MNTNKRNFLAFFTTFERDISQGKALTVVSPLKYTCFTKIKKVT